MGARAKPKAWGDRLPLDDIRGLRLLAAAIYHACSIDHQRAASAATDPITVQFEMIDCADPVKALARIESRVDRAEALVLFWRTQLAELIASDDEIAAGEHATLQDFIFDPADLWQHKTLALFVVEGQDSCWPAFDRDTPICRNSDFGRTSDGGVLCSLIDLVHQYWTWHQAPAHAKPLFNLEFGHQIEHVHWRNYLGPYCQAPTGRGHPKGPRWHDGRSAAAGHAWSLLYRAAKDGREISVAAAVRESVAFFKMLRPSDPEPPLCEAKEYIRASSPDQAEKAVRKILDQIVARESPWGHFDD
jgi:hypothetical protein